MASRRQALSEGKPDAPASVPDRRPPSLGPGRNRPRRQPPTALPGQTRGAWDAAHARALRATLALFELADPRLRRPHPLAWHPLVFAIGTSATDVPDDAGLRPFGTGAAELLWQVTDGLPPGDAGRSRRLDFVSAESHAWTTLRADRSWTALLHRDGAAGVAYGCSAHERPVAALGGPLSMAWAAAVELLVDRVDGSGRGRFTVLVNGALPRFGRRPVFYVDRAIDLVPPSAADVESVVAEIELATAESGEPAAPAS